MNTQEIKRGEFNAYFPISKVKMAKMNRDLVPKHIDNFKSKINEYGWMMPIIISKDNDVIEGHNRIKAAILLGQKTVPAYIVDWVDTSKEKEHLDSIINLNNGNRAWNNLDFLKSFSKYNKDYKIVYDYFLKNSNNISIGNVINCFFRKKSKFNKGTSTIENKQFAVYLLKNISRLVKKYNKNKIQAYCVREIINVGYAKAKMDVDVMDKVFQYYEGMAITSHEHLTSIKDFKKHIEYKLKDFNKND